MVKLNNNNNNKYNNSNVDCDINKSLLENNNANSIFFTSNESKRNKSIST